MGRRASVAGSSTACPASMLLPCPGREEPGPGSTAGARIPIRAGHASFPRPAREAGRPAPGTRRGPGSSGLPYPRSPGRAHRGGQPPRRAGHRGSRRDGPGPSPPRRTPRQAGLMGRLGSRPRPSGAYLAAAGRRPPPRHGEGNHRGPPVGQITAGRHPGKRGYQDGIIGAGQLLRIAQRLEAARRAARADDDPAYAGHDSAPSSRLDVMPR
jgi:hypothetical protein